MISKSLFLAPLIPEVLNDERLSLVDRVTLSIIIQLARIKGYCFANNSYIADNLNCSNGTVSKSINKLKKFGYITTNYPNPEKGGRGHCRTVRDDLFYVSESVSQETSHPNMTTLPTVKVKHTGLVKKRKDYNNELSPQIEKEIVLKELSTPFRNKWGYYEGCKSKFNVISPICWNKNSVLDLIALCNMLNQTYSEHFKKIPGKNRIEVAIEVFELLVKNKPTFFRDQLPKTFLRFFNEAISEKVFLNKVMSTIRRHDSSRDHLAYF